MLQEYLQLDGFKIMLLAYKFLKIHTTHILDLKSTHLKQMTQSDGYHIFNEDYQWLLLFFEKPHLTDIFFKQHSLCHYHVNLVFRSCKGCSGRLLLSFLPKVVCFMGVLFDKYHQNIHHLFYEIDFTINHNIFFPYDRLLHIFSWQDLGLKFIYLERVILFPFLFYFS